MNIQQIDKELQLLTLIIKLLKSLKHYLINTSQTEMQCFYRVLDLLKEKYNNTSDINFIEQGIRTNIQNHQDTIINNIKNISRFVYNYDNEPLLKDVLNCITTY
jgi:hypothetical protein